MLSHFDQARYQVRTEWGVDGLRRLAVADVVVVVDVLRFSTTVADTVALGQTVLLSAARPTSVDGAEVAQAAAASGSVVLLGCLRNARAVAEAVLEEQRRRRTRTSVAVIAAGEHSAQAVDAATDTEVGSRQEGRGGSAMRFAVEDLLGVGAIVDALSALGIDHTSPEAAASGEAFRGLRGAVRHLLTASGSGQELIDRGARAEVLRAAEVDASSAVPVLRDGVFVAGG